MKNTHEQQGIPAQECVGKALQPTDMGATVAISVAGSPNFSVLWRTIPQGTSDSFAAKVGGNVELNYNNPNGDFKNTCAMRLCYALNSGGYDVPFTNKQTISGFVPSKNDPAKQKKWFFFRVAEMEEHLDAKPSVFGKKQELTKAQTRSLSATLQGKQGILLFKQGFSNATGHATLWNKTSVPNSGVYDNDYSQSADSAVFYKLS